MRLDIKALAIAGAVVWGGGFFLVGLLNLLFPSYGTAFLELGASIYPGYHGPGGFGSVVVVTLYALLDGAVTAAILGWLYNLLLPKGPAPAQ
jgi:hypothetical protein